MNVKRIYNIVKILTMFYSYFMSCQGMREVEVVICDFVIWNLNFV